MNHEKDNVVDALAALCKEQGIQTLIQVGAEDGYEAFTIAKRIGCRAIAIEGNRDLRSSHPDLEFHHDVIGSMNCRVMFYVHTNTGLSGLIPRVDGQETPFASAQQRLDSWCDFHGGIQPDALIIDTEGTTLDVLKGCGNLIASMKVIYAECQTSIDRPGMSLISEVDELLTAKGMKQREGLPTYSVGSQGNYTWVRP